MTINHAIGIRAFIAANPGCTSAQIIAAVGLPGTTVWGILNNQNKRGLIIGTGSQRQRIYVIGREVHYGHPPGPKMDPEERRIRRAASQKKSQAKRRERLKLLRQGNAPKPSVRAQEAAIAEPVECASLDDFLAAGGQIERLPAHWSAPPKYPPIPDRFQR